jgi:hypothetical protein
VYIYIYKYTSIELLVEQSVCHDTPKTRVSTATEAFDRLEVNRRATLDPMNKSSLDQSVDISILNDDSLFPEEDALSTDLPSANRSQQSSSLKKTKSDIDKKEEVVSTESANSHIYFKGDEEEEIKELNTANHQNLEMSEDFTDNSNIFSIVKSQVHPGKYKCVCTYLYTDIYICVYMYLYTIICRQSSYYCGCH